jgi:hypothetical protein
MDELTSGKVRAAREVGDFWRSMRAVVDIPSRDAAVHDKLIGAVKSICEKHRSEGGRCFTQAQVECLTEIAFHVAYAVSMSHEVEVRRGFFASLWAEWRALAAMKKIATIAAVLVFLGTVITGSIWAYEKFIH